MGESRSKQKSFVPQAFPRPFLSHVGAALEGEAVSDHGDEFRVGGLALDVGYGVAEEQKPLQFNAYSAFCPRKNGSGF